MKRPFITAVAVSALFAAAALAQPITLNAVLTGSQEAPTPTTSPGYGFATVTLDATHTTLTVNVVFTKLTSAVTGAHIHGPDAPAGVAKGVLVSFNVPANLSGNQISGTFTIPSSVGDGIYANPANYYTNVHTTQNPGGEIRGQLAASTGTVYYAGDLRGTNETPSNSSTAVGAYFISLDQANNLKYEIHIGSVVNPTRAHIHPGAAGIAGSPIITFATSPSAFQNGRLKGTLSVASLTSDQLNGLRTTPQNFYVNVHSNAAPGGEIRSQLSFANEYDVAVAGKVTNGLGQNFVTDARVFNPSFDTPIGALIEFFPAGAANTSASASTVMSIAPRGTAILNDVNGPALLNVTGTGALRVSAATKLAVTSRIYNDQRSSGKGTFGQFAPGINRGSLLMHGVLPQLSNQSDLTSGSRTNIGFFNPNAGTANVRIEVRDETGTSIAVATLALAGLSQQQNNVASYFPGVDFSARQNLTLTFDSSLPIGAYGSVVDNVSSDQIFVVAQEDGGPPKS